MARLPKVSGGINEARYSANGGTPDGKIQHTSKPHFGPSKSLVQHLKNIEILDSSLRDGAQDPRIKQALTNVDTRLAVARIIDTFFQPTIIEGGWPGSNPADTEFFHRAQNELKLEHATLAAFGSTARVGMQPEEDKGFMALLDSGAPIIVLVAKCSRFQAEQVLGISGEANLKLIESSIKTLRKAGRRVILDAEHAFDGFAGIPLYQPDPIYAKKVLATAIKAGADTLVLCDTNGGTMPSTIAQVTRYVVGDKKLNAIYHKTHGRKKLSIGIHAHDDRKRAIDNTFSALEAGATHAQFTLNGGERLGNTDLLTFKGILRENYGINVATDEILAQWKMQSEKIHELSGLPIDKRRSFVGDYANITKAGFHASGLRKHKRAYISYESTDYGLHEGIIISEMIGKDGVKTRLEQLHFPYEITTEFAKTLTQKVKSNVVKESIDYVDAEASFYLLALRMHEKYKAPFTITTRQQQGMVVAKIQNNLKKKDKKIALPVDPVEVANIIKSAIGTQFKQLSDIEITLPEIKTDNGIPKIYITAYKSSHPHISWTTMHTGHNIPEATVYAVSDALELAIHNALKPQK